MTYHLDDEKINLNDLRKRIEETDLVPSRASLLVEIRSKFKLLEQADITTLANLRSELKNFKHLEAISRITGIDTSYLILLRREIESYFPKPFSLLAFDWLPKVEIAKLEAKKISNTATLYNSARNISNLTEFANSNNMDVVILAKLVQLADLTRVQWVSPKAARMLADATYDSVTKLATADANDLYQALLTINEGNRYFKGKIGLRDVKRLIRAASYLPN
jgi:hypothetical protein